ncbi:MAG TPA: hypothetical protein VLG14_07870 [Sphingomonas sp.]|nr:hypothetical protein [Sphingomonas sp.]
MDWVDIVGWAGAVLVLAAYALVSTKRLDGDSIVYQSLNVAGAMGMLINTYVRGALPSAALNVIWIGMGVYVLAKVIFGRRRDA